MNSLSIYAINFLQTYYIDKEFINPYTGHGIIGIAEIIMKNAAIFRHSNCWSRFSKDLKTLSQIDYL